MRCSLLFGPLLLGLGHEERQKNPSLAYFEVPSLQKVHQTAGFDLKCHREFLGGRVPSIVWLAGSRIEREYFCWLLGFFLHAIKVLALILNFDSVDLEGWQFYLSKK